MPDPRLSSDQGSVVLCPECNGRKTLDYGMADSMGGPLNEWCDTCGGTGFEPPGHEEDCASTQGPAPCDCGYTAALDEERQS